MCVLESAGTVGVALGMEESIPYGCIVCFCVYDWCGGGRGNFLTLTVSFADGEGIKSNRFYIQISLALVFFVSNMATRRAAIPAVSFAIITGTSISESYPAVNPK